MTPNISGSFFVTFTVAFALIVAIAAAVGWYAAKNLKKAEGNKTDSAD